MVQTPTAIERANAVQSLPVRTLYVFFSRPASHRSLERDRPPHAPLGAAANHRSHPRGAAAALPPPGPRCALRRDFAARARCIGIETLLTPFRTPRANAIAQRFVRTVRRKCLDHVIVWNERHLRRVLREYVAYYNTMPSRMPGGSSSGQRKWEASAELYLGQSCSTSNPVSIRAGRRLPELSSLQAFSSARRIALP